MRALLVAVVLLLAGCTLPPPPTTTTTSATTSSSTTTRPVDGHEVPAFDGVRALDEVRAQVLDANGSVRYRVPGTAGNDEAARHIADRLAATGWRMTWDNWTEGYQCHDIKMHNVVGSRDGTSGRTVILGAHYDTRPIAEADADAANRTRPIPGANDGASGVGVLLELARVLPAVPDAVRLVFFDAEDGGDMGDGCTDWLLGSRHFAENMSAAEVASTRAMVLVDLVGDPTIELPREALSDHALQDRIYAIAGGLGHASIFSNTSEHRYAITDDHKPFLDRGIPSVDLIHLVAAPQYFPEWHHTQHDDLAHVSASSLAAVGRTLEIWLRAG